jgi:formate dehydrogenase major subunit
MVNITIDGKQIEIAEGTTVLTAARSAGIEIPTLCDHPELTPDGGCRLCLVEVDGMRTLQPSCTLPVMNNMVVRTDTPKTKDARKFILNMLFSERNHFCPYCQVSGGDCELQNAAYHEGMTHWALQPNWKPYPVDASHPYIILEHNRCILCRRCVRACGELVGNFTLGFEERGASSTLVADLGVPLGESSCVGCGTCVQVCPTGALIERWSAYQGRETEVEHHPTICVGCSIGCGIDVLTRDNRLVRIEGDWDAPVNKGVICEVGRFHPMGEDRERLVTPLVRKNGSLKAATWDEALSLAAERLMNKKGKPAAFISTRLPLESMDAFQQLCNGLGIKATSLEEGKRTMPSSELAESLKSSYESKLDSLMKADCVLVLGEDITRDHWVISFFVKRLIPNGCKVITLDEKDNGLDNFAAVSLKSKNASHAEVVNALTASFKTDQPDFSKVSKSSGISMDQLKSVNQVMKSAKNFVIVIGYAEDKEASNKDLLKSAQILAKQAGASILDVKGGANSLAASQLQLDTTIDLNGIEVCLLAIGDERPSQQLIKRFEKVPFLIIQSSYVSPLTANAQVVFPVQNWLEQEGTYLNFSGNLQKASPSLKSIEGVVSNQEVFVRLAEKTKIKMDPNCKAHLTKRVSPVTID